MPKATSAVPVFPVSSLATSLQHYAALGFAPEYLWPEAAGAAKTYAIVRLDGATLHLAQHDTPSPSLAYVFVEDVQGLLATVKSRGVTLSRDLESFEYGMTEFEIADPDGNTLTFAEAT